MIEAKPLLPFGVQLLENPFLTVGPFENWSNVRSPGRARRRRALGHPQRITFYSKPDPKIYKMPDGSIVGHPATLRQFKRAVAQKGTRHD